MGINKTVGFVIRSLDYRESDRIVTIFSRDFGKFSGIAKGSRKTDSRFGSSLDLLNLDEFVFYESETLKFLSEADTLNFFPELKRSYAKVERAFQAAKLLDRATEENHREPELFFLFNAYLGALERAADQLRSIDLSFKLRLLKGVGLGPRLDRCAVCGQALEDEVRFSVERGGLLGQTCYRGEGVAVEPGVWRSLSQLAELPIDRAERISLGEARSTCETLIDRFIAYHIGWKGGSRADAQKR